jgi:outer membrane protein assembly factor BamA
VTSSPGFGSGLGFMSMFFYRPDQGDKVSPNSSLAGIGAYSDTDSYAFGLFNKLYLDEDRWRLDFGVMDARIRSDLTVDGVDDIRFDTQFVGVFAKAQRRIGSSAWYAGATASFISQDYTSRNAQGDAYFTAFNVQDEQQGSVGAVATLDTRDNQRFPTAGVLADASVSLYPEWLGVTEGYEVLQLSGNWYRELFPDHVLALRAFGRFTPPGTPYAGLSKLGMRSDLRAYTPGEIVAENLIDAQAEWRWMFAERFGVVGFGGAAGLYDGGISHLDSDSIYWSGGLGLRYTLSVENKLNFRLDYAWGEDDESGFYISMGEAF